MSFVDFARSHGLAIHDLDVGERVRRCATLDHPRKRNGAYFFDGRRGWVFAWDGDARVHWYADGGTEWSDADKRQWMLRRQTMAVQRERSHELAALRAQALLQSAGAGPHDYLIRKGLADVPGLKLHDGALLVPMRDVLTYRLVGAQLIRWRPEERQWEKKMLPGMRAKGAVLRLGPPKAREVVLCEGYATGLSIDAAVKRMRLSMTVMVCFSDSNLVHVAPLLKCPALVFADHDASGAGQRAAQATGLPLCMSDTEGEDANDLHVRAGLQAVCAKLMRARQRDP